MTLSRMKSFRLMLPVLPILVAFGCHGKQPAPPPPPAASTTPTPPPPTPTITLRAEPATIERGGSTTLQWEARNAASVTITPELGTVSASGNRSVTPVSSVSYTATASGPGGSASDIARVTVNVPAAPPPDTTPTRRPDVTSGNLFDQNVKDVFFDYDKAEIKGDNVTTLQKNASWLKTNPSARFTIEGYCDERGSEEYNLALGDRRANAVKEFLIGQGVAGNRINTVSYGEERPVCRDASEECYAKNRRAHFATAP